MLGKELAEDHIGLVTKSLLTITEVSGQKYAFLDNFEKQC